MLLTAVRLWKLVTITPLTHTATLLLSPPPFSCCSHSVSMFSSSCSTKHLQSSSSLAVASSTHCSTTLSNGLQWVIGFKISKHQGVLHNHTCNGLRFSFNGTIYSSAGKANVATHHKWYQPLMGHSLLDHGLAFVYQMGMLPFSWTAHVYGNQSQFQCI